MSADTRVLSVGSKCVLWMILVWGCWGMFVQTASGAPALTLSTTSLHFTVAESPLFPPPPLTSPPPQFVYLSSNGVPLTFSVSTSPASANWLKATPVTGTVPASPSSVLLRVSVDLTVFGSQAALEQYLHTACPLMSQLGPVCTAAITVSAPGAAIIQQQIAVTVFIVYPTFCYSLTPNEVDFTYQIGGSVPAPAVLNLFAPANCPPQTRVTTSAQVLTPSGGSWLSVSNSGNVIMAFVSPGGLPPGDYVGIVDALGSLQSAVRLTVSAARSLSVSPSPLNFTFQGGGTIPASQSLSVGGDAGLVFSAVATSAAGWLSVNPGGGTTPASVNVAVNSANLAPGNYSGSIRVTSAGASNSPQTVPVNLTVAAAPSLTVPTAPVNFSFQSGGPVPAAQSVLIASAGGNVTYMAVANSSGWLSVSSGGGTTPSSVSISVNPAGLAANTYTGSIVFSSASASNSPQTIPVNLTIRAAPTLMVPAAPLNFAFQIGGTPPPSQSVQVGSSGSILMFMAAASSSGWLSANPSSGSTPSSVSVSVSPSGLAAGSYNGSVTFTASASSNGAGIVVPVTLTVTTAPALVIATTPLVFTFPSGSTTAATQTVAIASSGANVPFTASVGGLTGVSLSAAGGTTPSQITVTANPAGSATGSYNGTITISAAGVSNSPQSIPVTVTIMQSANAPIISSNGVVNAASSPSALISPGSLFTIFGANMATGTTSADSTPLPTSLGGTSVEVNGRSVPLVFVNSGQINAQLPYEIAPSRVNVAVVLNGVRSAPSLLDVVNTGPGIFLVGATNHAVIQNQDYSLNSSSVAAKPGSYVTVYLTGSGALDNTVPTGSVAPNSPFSVPLAKVEATIAGVPANIYFAGLTPGLVGVMQINIQIPAVSAGEQPLVVKIGGVSSNSAMISVGN
jgi:uncharacterized protein (TIGR03437 family)